MTNILEIYIFDLFLNSFIIPYSTIFFYYVYKHRAAKYLEKRGTECELKAVWCMIITNKSIKRQQHVTHIRCMRPDRPVNPRVSPIASVMTLFSTKKYEYFSYFCTKTYVVGTHQKCLGEALLMRTHNICFCADIRKIIYLISTLIWRYGISSWDSF